MVKKIEDLNFYELLEISPSANSQEVHRAYERVRRIYEPNSIALYSLLTSEETGVIHKRIEEAYQTLMYESRRKKYDEILKSEQHLHDALPPVPGVERADKIPGEQTAFRAIAKPTPINQSAQKQDSMPLNEQPAPAPAPPPPFNAEFTGPAIKFLREQRNLGVRELSNITKIGSRYLELIEAEDYQKLPARPYLRGFLALYAKALGYDPERVLADYMKRYDAAMNPEKK